MALMTFSPKVNANWKGGEKKERIVKRMNGEGRKNLTKKKREKQEIKKVEDVVEKV